MPPRRNDDLFHGKRGGGQSQGRKRKHRKNPYSSSENSSDTDSDDLIAPRQATSVPKPNAHASRVDSLARSLLAKAQSEHDKQSPSAPATTTTNTTQPSEMRSRSASTMPSEAQKATNITLSGKNESDESSDSDFLSVSAAVRQKIAQNSAKINAEIQVYSQDREDARRARIETEAKRLQTECARRSRGRARGIGPLSVGAGGGRLNADAGAANASNRVTALALPAYNMPAADRPGEAIITSRALGSENVRSKQPQDSSKRSGGVLALDTRSDSSSVGGAGTKQGLSSTTCTIASVQGVEQSVRVTDSATEQGVLSLDCDPTTWHSSRLNTHFNNSCVNPTDLHPVHRSHPFIAAITTDILPGYRTAAAAIYRHRLPALAESARAAREGLSDTFTAMNASETASASPATDPTDHIPRTLTGLTPQQLRSHYLPWRMQAALPPAAAVALPSVLSLHGDSLCVGYGASVQILNTGGYPQDGNYKSCRRDVSATIPVDGFAENVDPLSSFEREGDAILIGDTINGMKRVLSSQLPASRLINPNSHFNRSPAVEAALDDCPVVPPVVATIIGDTRAWPCWWRRGDSDTVMGRGDSNVGMARSEADNSDGSTDVSSVHSGSNDGRNRQTSKSRRKEKHSENTKNTKATTAAHNAHQIPAKTHVFADLQVQRGDNCRHCQCSLGSVLASDPIALYRGLGRNSAVQVAKSNCLCICHAAEMQPLQNARQLLCDERLKKSSFTISGNDDLEDGLGSSRLLLNGDERICVDYASDMEYSESDSDSDDDDADNNNNMSARAVSRCVRNNLNIPSSRVSVAPFNVFASNFPRHSPQSSSMSSSAPTSIPANLCPVNAADPRSLRANPHLRKMLLLGYASIELDLPSRSPHEHSRKSVADSRNAGVGGCIQLWGYTPDSLDSSLGRLQFNAHKLRMSSLPHRPRAPRMRPLLSVCFPGRSVSTACPDTVLAASHVIGRVSGGIFVALGRKLVWVDVASGKQRKIHTFESDITAVSVFPLTQHSVANATTGASASHATASETHSDAHHANQQRTHGKSQATTRNNTRTSPLINLVICGLRNGHLVAFMDIIPTRRATSSCGITERPLSSDTGPNAGLSAATATEKHGFEYLMDSRRFTSPSPVMQLSGPVLTIEPPQHLASTLSTPADNLYKPSPWPSPLWVLGVSPLRFTCGTSLGHIAAVRLSSPALWRLLCDAATPHSSHTNRPSNTTAAVSVSHTSVSSPTRVTTPASLDTPLCTTIASPTKLLALLPSASIAVAHRQGLVFVSRELWVDVFTTAGKLVDQIIFVSLSPHAMTSSTSSTSSSSSSSSSSSLSSTPVPALQVALHRALGWRSAHACAHAPTQKVAVISSFRTGRVSFPLEMSRKSYPCGVEGHMARRWSASTLPWADIVGLCQDEEMWILRNGEDSEEITHRYFDECERLSADITMVLRERQTTTSGKLRSLQEKLHVAMREFWGYTSQPRTREIIATTPRCGWCYMGMQLTHLYSNQRNVAADFLVSDVHELLVVNTVRGVKCVDQGCIVIKDRISATEGGLTFLQFQ